MRCSVVFKQAFFGEIPNLITVFGNCRLASHWGRSFFVYLGYFGKIIIQLQAKDPFVLVAHQ